MKVKESQSKIKIAGHTRGGGDSMSSLSDYIEQYIMEKLAAAGGAVELQRNELAARFNCVPSQINYVISTRFTRERGFIVESRRGGGGYIRILRIQLPEENKLLTELDHFVGSQISQRQAEDIIYRLANDGIINTREMAILLSILDRQTLDMRLPERDMWRARLLKAALLGLIKHVTKGGYDDDL